MRTSLAKILAIIAFGVITTACGPTAYLITEQDPSQIPQKQDPVFVTVGEHSSIPERQLLSVLKRRMVAMGFNVVEEVNSAKWVLGALQDEKTFATGTTSNGFALPLGHHGIYVLSGSKNTVNYKTDSRIFLALFAASEFSQKNPQAAIWVAQSTSKPEVLREYSTTIIDDLLAAYGTNYHDERMMRFQDHPK